MPSSILKRFSKHAIRFACIAIAASLMMLLAGCATQATDQADEEVDKNRQYMADVNQTVSQLSDKLDGFVDAVSRGDIVAMKTQADNAFEVLAALESLEVPNDLKDLGDGYVKACNDLEDALKQYIDLYSDVQSASGGSFDSATYDSKLKEIQKLYDEAIETLKSTDQTATDLKK